MLFASGFYGEICTQINKENMRKNCIFCFLYLLLFVMTTGCTEEPDNENSSETEGKKEDNIRDVWSFDVKIMLDRKTFESYGSDISIVNGKLTKRFNEVRELYHGKKGITYFDADFEFKPFFNETCVYDRSSEEVFQAAETYRGAYCYLIVIDGCIGDYKGERVHSDWTGSWTGKKEVVCLFDNNKGAPDGGTTVYDILSPYKTSEALAHELGHGRGAPDIYAMEVKVNPVNSQTFSPVKCIMNLCWGGDSWSEYTQLLINRNKNLIMGEKGFVPQEQPQYPEKLTLKVTRNKQEVPYVDVNIYREKMYENSIQTTPLKNSTNSSGELELSPVSLFNSGTSIGYGVLLIEVVEGTGENAKKSYQWLPVYEVQMAFLKGITDIYRMEIKI
jgi:hypothetical protein